MFSGCHSLRSFEQIKEQTIEFFNENQTDFITAKDTILTTKSTDGVFVDDIDYIRFSVVETSDIITFDYGAQGMLGGQYWGIIFSSDDIPRFDTSISTLTESETEGFYFWKEPDGNNICALERIAENWFFYYLDYDGHLDV